MEDSQTRRSSIPILKQTNKTKSFQSFVSLNLSDDLQQQKSRSPPSASSISSVSSVSPPIVENTRIPPKFLPRTSMQVSHLEIDNDIVITKLCDENKRLKEHQTQLVSKFEEGGKIYLKLYIIFHNFNFSCTREYGNSEQKRRATKGNCKPEKGNLRESNFAKTMRNVSFEIKLLVPNYPPIDILVCKSNNKI